MGVCVSFWIGTFFSITFFCDPVSKQWLSDESGTCGDSHALYQACGITDLIIDIIVVLMPFPVLWHLQLSTRKKLALVSVFGLGFV